MSKKQKNDFLYVLEKDNPVYDQSKPYYDQSKEVLDFYDNEYRKITEGAYIDGYFIHPFLYWHINFFKTMIPELIKGSETETEEVLRLAPLDDHILYFIDNLKRCTIEQRGAFLFGTRGFTKTSLITSYISWIATTKENGTSEIIGGNDSDLSAISRLLDIAFTHVHPAFRLPKNISNWTKHIEFGIKNKRQERIRYSDIFIKNANAGKKSSSEKGAGGSPVAFVLDEAGKWSFIKLLQSALPAFKTQYGMKAFPLLSGTGGENELSKDARKVLKNPEAYDLLEMDYNVLNKQVPKEYRTWNEQEKFGIFVPGQMSYRLPVPKIKTNLAEFLGIESKYLSRLELNKTDWKSCKEYIEKERERLSKDEDALNKFKMYHPITSSECFLENSVNPFPTKVARRHLEKLREVNSVKPMELFRNSTEWVTTEFSDKKIAGFPHDGSNIDSPVMVYSNHEIPKEKPPYGMYVSGLDGYKQDQAEFTESLGSFYVLQRRHTEMNLPCERIVCSYSSRPDLIREFHKQCEDIIEIYNAECCMESADQGFLQYLDMKGKAHDLLAPSVSFGSVNSKKKSKLNTKFGIYPTAANQSYMMNLVIEYCKEPHEIDMDEHGNKIVKLGIEFIDDEWLLEEMIQYKPGKNVDRIIAFAHALAWARELDKQDVKPEFRAQKKTNEKKRTKVNKPTGFFGKKRFNPF